MKRPASLVLIVLYKGVLGILEILGGGAVLLFSFFSGKIVASDWVQGLIAHELAEDPQDRFINWLLGINWQDIYHVSLRIGAFLIFLGIIKIILAIGVWRGSILIRNIGLVFFIGLTLFGIYDLAVSFSALKVIAFIIDLWILYYFWRVLPRHILAMKQHAALPPQ